MSPDGRDPTMATGGFVAATHGSNVRSEPAASPPGFTSFALGHRLQK